MRLPWEVAQNKIKIVSIVNFMYVWGPRGAPENMHGGVDVIMLEKRLGHGKLWKREIEDGRAMRRIIHWRFCSRTYINFDTSRTVFWSVLFCYADGRERFWRAQFIDVIYVAHLNFDTPTVAE